MNPERREKFLHRWAGREVVYEPTDEPPSRPRRFEFKRSPRPEEDYLNDRRGEPNIILDGRIRVTKIGRWQWNEATRAWCGYGEQWNRFSKTWSEPRLFHVKDWECEGNTMSQI